MTKKPVFSVKAWRAPNEDGTFRMMRADGKMTTWRLWLGEDAYAALQDEWERRAAEVLNNHFPN